MKSLYLQILPKANKDWFGGANDSNAKRIIVSRFVLKSTGDNHVIGMEHNLFGSFIAN
jgi:hypothetical protein